MADTEVEALDLLGGVMDLVKARMSAALSAEGQKLLLMEAHVLRIVLARQNCTQLDVVRETRRDKAQIGKLIRSLVGYGLLRQSPDPSDARRQRLILTAEGEEAARRCQQHRLTIAKQLFAGVSAQDRDVLVETLSRIESHLDAA
ncbi:MarR family winged helix-turn-helix transcriptional regulator [Caulobacter sp. UNC358MFTsu5.1]|uniref:MarR family winged helix-turn-helix transcriptional regulator n=1 Tax=Caulobacter sp. UNC358MFTsu5.1 TaxID=1449049 RepID=UPI00068F5CAD|nr:winged helix DNA-binding protein [Caulobacter sp. UNC358MFTsu5.1]